MSHFRWHALLTLRLKRIQTVARLLLITSAILSLEVASLAQSVPARVDARQSTLRVDGTGQRVTSAASTANPFGSAISTSGSLPGGSGADTVISPDDMLEIYIIDVPELSGQYRVSARGLVQLPLLQKPLVAAGLEADEFGTQIAKELREAGLVNEAHVTVSIAASRVKSIAITGAVKHPQIYPVFGRTTLLDVISQAEGLADDASMIAIISRGEMGLLMIADDEKEKTVTVDLSKLLQAGDASANLDVYPGDRITVPRAGIVYVVGAVNRPGGFTIRSINDTMTVLQALALAEDVKSTAVRSKTVLIRKDASAQDGRKQIPLDLSKILSGKAEDPVLQANDILFIPDSQSKKAFRRSLEAAMQTAVGMAIYRPQF